MQKAASEVYCKSNFLNEAFWYNGDKEYFSEWNVNVKKKTMLRQIKETLSQDKYGFLSYELSL